MAAKVLFDKNDLPDAKKLKDERIGWLQELDATEIHTADHSEDGFLFGYHHGNEAYRKQVAGFSCLRDRPEEREVLIEVVLE